MTLHRKVALFYFVVLLGAAALNYIPGVTDEEGVAFGVFELDIFDDSLHLASAIWALAAALISTRASWLFLVIFGALTLLTLCLLLLRIGRSSAEKDPMLDPRFNPQIRVDQAAVGDNKL